MVAFTIGSVVLVPFPFSDLSQAKFRPALVLADTACSDWILCQIASKPYTHLHGITLDKTDFKTGYLYLISYARPGKLFTANES